MSWTQTVEQSDPSNDQWCNDAIVSFSFALVAKNETVKKDDATFNQSVVLKSCRLLFSKEEVQFNSAIQF